MCPAPASSTILKRGHILFRAWPFRRCFLEYVTCSLLMWLWLLYLPTCTDVLDPPPGVLWFVHWSSPGKENKQTNKKQTKPKQNSKQTKTKQKQKHQLQQNNGVVALLMEEALSHTKRERTGVGVKEKKIDQAEKLYGLIQRERGGNKKGDIE